MKFRMAALAVAIAASGALIANAAETPSPKDAKVYFVNLKDGAKAKSPVLVQFGLSGMGIAPAGVEMENTGHHHVFVDADPPKKGEPIPADAKHIHFGKGQTEARIELPPGRHTLQLVLGDFTHTPHAPMVMSPKITITVEK